MTVIIITHKLYEVMAISDRVGVMRKGRLIGVENTADVTERSLASMMVGRPVLYESLEKTGTPGEELISADDLVVRGNRGLVAVNGVSLSVRAGEILGIAAIEGNGQSELLEAVTGMRALESGSVRICGKEAAGKSPGEIRALGLAHIPEDRLTTGVSRDATTADNLIMGRQREKRFSGPLMNFVIAFLVIALFMSAIGVNAVVPKVAQVEETAQAAGLQIGDEITAVNGETVATSDAIAKAISASGGEAVTLTVKRDGRTLDLTLTPFYDAQAGRYRVGFSFGQERVRVSVFESVPFSLQYNVESVRLILSTLKNLVFKGQGVDDVTGPVGTVYVIQEVTQQGGFEVYLELLALISVNLGVMNLLPIPGLDGSRLLFLLVEAIRRKPVKRELEGAIHAAGFILLMGLMVLLTYKDIMRFFVKG